MLLCCWCFLIPFNHCNTNQDISQDDFMVSSRVVTAATSYFCPKMLVPLGDKACGLL